MGYSIVYICGYRTAYGIRSFLYLLKRIKRNKKQERKRRKEGDSDKQFY